jgi:serine protease
VSGLDDYFYFQGTSMATPHVAGVAALVASQGIKDPAEVRAILLKSAHKRGPREKYGAGELDAAAAVRLARSENGLYYGQLALIGGVWLWCGVVGLGRRGRAPAAAALAVTIGLVLPDLITSMAGFDSAWNLVGHSVLLPGYLLVSEAETQKERRFLALLAAATTAHLALDLAAGTAPVIGSQPFAALPWLWANVAVGAGAFVSGLRR